MIVLILIVKSLSRGQKLFHANNRILQETFTIDLSYYWQSAFKNRDCSVKYVPMGRLYKQLIMSHSYVLVFVLFFRKLNCMFIIVTMTMKVWCVRYFRRHSYRLYQRVGTNGQYGLLGWTSCKNPLNCSYCTWLILAEDEWTRETETCVC